MIIPHQQLAADTLRALVEEFITREGTDYGDVEFALVNKVAQVMAQLEAGEVVIVFDPAQESVSLLTRRQAAEVEQELQLAQQQAENAEGEYGYVEAIDG